MRASAFLRVSLVGLLVAACVTLWPATGIADSSTPEQLNFPLRSQTLTLWIYRPSGTPKGTIVMSSGDVGWVGLAVSMSEFLSARGYVVIGVNSRQYLSAFTKGKQHLTVDDTPVDFGALRDLLAANNLLFRPTILSGVSEGAAIAVLAASHERNHPWLDGVVTMGVPAVAELAWRWRDFTAWITSGDANEPSFSPLDYIGHVAPLPLVMIQSTRDEYVTEADYRSFEAAARHPKKLVLIAANNHRFTNKQDELHAEMLSALAWIGTTGVMRAKPAGK
jgi:type IV secretory pathway VirJ component